MGPGLVTLIALMSGKYHLSVREIQRLLKDLYALAFSLGAIANALGLATEALAVPYVQIGADVCAAEVAHADETRHPRGGGKRPSTWWMWTMTTASAGFFGVHYSSGRMPRRRCSGSSPGCW